VKATDGARCGAPGFVRVNLGTAHHVLEEIAQRLGHAADATRATGPG
jgi:bifunctional pyridoxal-dependent enzyme with beta-cystathionase and maltose regulon repressor activities